MADQYAEYVSKNYTNRFIVSRQFDESPPGRIRIYGEGNPDDPSFVGITFHYPGRWDEFPETRYSDHIEPIIELGDIANVPVIWVGEYVESPTPSDNLEIAPLTQSENVEDILVVCPLKDSIDLLWDWFDVDTTPPGQGKSFNEAPVDGFHEFTIDKLGLTTIDLDLIALDQSDSPIGLIEIKRSNILDIDDWYPFVGAGGDKPNYILQMAAAEQTSTDAFVISQPGSGFLGADDSVYLYDFQNDEENTARDFGKRENPTIQDPHLSYSREKLTTQEATERILNS